MDFEKLLTLATDHLAGYVEAFIRTLTGSWTAAQSTKTSAVLNADLWVFLFLSVLIGSSLATVSTGRKGKEIQTVVVYVVVNWLAFSAFVFLLSLVFGSTTDFLSLARVTLYSLGVAYVVASFASLLVSIFTADRFGDKAAIAKFSYVIVHAFLLAVLLYMNFHSLNHLVGWKAALFSVLAPVPPVLLNLILASGVLFHSALADFNLRK